MLADLAIVLDGSIPCLVTLLVSSLILLAIVLLRFLMCLLVGLMI